MSDYAELSSFYTAWLWWWLKTLLRELWDDIPGPLPVKIAVMVVVVAALLFPGQADEIVVIGLIRGIAYIGRKRRESKCHVAVRNESA